MARPSRLLLALSLLSLFSLAACGSERATPPRASVETAARVVLPAAPETRDPVYSPFLLDVSEAPFGLISFKDVGMSLPAEERALVYESLAEELSLALRRDLAPMSSMVRHDAAITDPNNHVVCTGRQIYVDLWSEADGWGYSLWSGCSEDDEFAHRAVRVDRTDRLASLDPLADDIAKSLRAAVRRNCFTRLC